MSGLSASYSSYSSCLLKLTIFCAQTSEINLEVFVEFVPVLGSDVFLGEIAYNPLFGIAICLLVKVLYG